MNPRRLHSATSLSISAIGEHSKTDSKPQRAQRTQRAVLADHSFQAIFQKRDVEVDEQTQTKVGRLQIRKHLGLVDTGELIYGLHLDNDSATHKEVQPLSFDEYALVGDEDFLLILERQATTRQLMMHGPD